MFIKSTFLLILLTLAQISWAKPTSIEDIVFPKGVSHTTYLCRFFARIIRTTLLEYVNAGRLITQRLLKNIDALNGTSTKILEFKQNLTKFEELYDESEGWDHPTENLFELREAYLNITSSYFALEENSLDDDSKLIPNLLKEYESDKCTNAFDEKTHTILRVVTGLLDAFKMNIMQEKSDASKELLDWFSHLATVNSYDEEKQAVWEKFGVF